MEETERRSDQLTLNFEGSKFKTKPFDHQIRCLNQFGRFPAFALAAEMGTGKTWIIINNVADLWASGDCDALLVLAPNGVHTNWTRIELSKHTPDWVRYRAAAWTASPTKIEKRALDGLFETPFTGELRILTMNHEALQSKRGFEYAKNFLRSTSKAMIVADESDAFKNPSAVRTKNLMMLKKMSKWRRTMTGTPVNNSPFDLFAQYTFLDEFILGTTSFYAFKAEYAMMLPPNNPLVQNIMAKSRGRGVPQVVAKGAGGRPKYQNLDKLSKLIAPYTFRVLKKECLDLPEKIYKTLIFNITKEQTAVYKKAEEECRIVFQNEETPFNKLVSVTKLAQITSGYYIHPATDDPVRIEGDNPKLELLAERVGKIVESGEKVIVWARYRIEIEDIVKRLRAEGIESVEYHGGVKKGERIDAIEDFERGGVQVFVGNQQAGGTGITLVSASYVIYFSNDFSLRNRLQSEDRAHRIGQKKNVTYINIAAKGTIDEHVIRTLMSKQDVADTIIDRGLALFG